MLSNKSNKVMVFISKSVESCKIFNFGRCFIVLKFSEFSPILVFHKPEKTFPCDEKNYQELGNIRIVVDHILGYQIKSKR